MRREILGKRLQLNPLAGFNPAPGQVITLIHNQGPSAVNGHFQGLPEGTIIYLNNIKFIISYVGNANHQDLHLAWVGGARVIKLTPR